MGKQHTLIDTWVLEKGGGKKFGHLYEVSDSTITLIPQIELGKMNRDLMTVNYSKISVIALREDNRKSRMFIKFIPVALITGFVGGGILYSLEGNNNVSFFGLGFASGTAVGLIAGTVIGAFKVTIPIKGKYENFKKNKPKLKLITVK